MEYLENELMRYYDNLGQSVLATNDFKKGAFRVHKDKAKNYQWITYRPQQLLTYLLFDFDSKDPYFVDKCKELGLKPNITIQNPNSKKGQILFRMEDFISCGKNSNKKIVKYYDSTRKALNNALGCDKQYTNRFAKNPFYMNGFIDKANNKKLKDNFILNSYTDKGYKLKDFNEFLEVENEKEREIWEANKAAVKANHKHRKVNKSLDLSEGNRNKSMFQHVRYFAYSVVSLYRQMNDREGLLKAIISEASYFNEHIPDALPMKEILELSESVSKWTYNNHCPKQHKEKIAKCKKYIQRGKLALKVAHCETLQERQIVAASETNKTRKDATESKIRAACYDLKIEDKTITYKAIAERSKLSLRTIERNKELVKKIKSIK